MVDFERITAIFHAAIEREAGLRAAFLDEACRGDTGLRAEVESLLAAHEQAAGFLEVPAAVASGLATSETDVLPEGTLLGRYRIEREIDRGGMGIVYLAEDTGLGRKVAIKLLPPEHTRDERRLERMRLEARAAAALSHPGIATVFALEEIDGRLCLVYEYVRGQTLRAEIERGPLPPATLLETGVQLAEALAAAHAAGVVHRDIKPENIIRDPGGRVRILDFGVARFDPVQPLPFRRLTDAGLVLGTPGYMSPEQLEGGEVDARSDIFSLGVVMFELASGAHPFETATPASTAARVLTAETPDLRELNPGVTTGFERIVRKCLRKDPAERFQSAAEVTGALKALQGGKRPLPGLTGPDGWLARRRGPLSFRGWWILHQSVSMLVATFMVWPVGIVHQVVGSDWTLAWLLGVIGVAAANVLLRANLVSTALVNPVDLRAQVQRVGPLLRRSDWVFAALLLAAAVSAARPRTRLSAVLAAVSFGWLVAARVIEPSARRAAFSGKASSPVRR